jgi:HAE1 family hydrophobic/amphiphilic exporter-1
MMGETVQNFLIAALLSIVFIYIVLAAQFNSFTQPLIIMASIPLSIPFGLLSLAVFNQSLNIDSMIGMLLLFGIIKKNAILQVDYTNTLIEQGMNPKEAILEADKARFRPILMTTLTIMAGMLPIAMGKGDGSAPRASMATLIIGGQALSLFITLLITPVLYSLYIDAKELKGKLKPVTANLLTKFRRSNNGK